MVYLHKDMVYQKTIDGLVVIEGAYVLNFWITSLAFEHQMCFDLVLNI